MLRRVRRPFVGGGAIEMAPGRMGMRGVVAGNISAGDATEVAGPQRARIAKQKSLDAG